MRINRDVIVAIVLLVLCATLYAASYSIRQTSYGTIGSELWPRIVIIVLTIFTLIYFVISLRMPPPPAGDDTDGGGLAGFYASYRNPIWCFVAYGAFLAVLPYVGMLVGGILFVFTALTLLGEWRPRTVAVHGAIAVGTVGAMWALFTFGLRVILPEGELFRTW